jgi:hypothetical protein
MGAQLPGGHPGGQVVGEQPLTLSHKLTEARPDRWTGSPCGEKERHEFAVLGEHPLEPVRDLGQHLCGQAIARRREYTAQLREKAAFGQQRISTASFPTKWWYSRPYVTPAAAVMSLIVAPAMPVSTK